MLPRDSNTLNSKFVSQSNANARKYLISGPQASTLFKSVDLSNPNQQNNNISHPSEQKIIEKINGGVEYIDSKI